MGHRGRSNDGPTRIDSFPSVVNCLHRVQGYIEFKVSYRIEAAQRMNLPPGCIANRLHRTQLKDFRTDLRTAPQKMGATYSLSPSPKRWVPSISLLLRLGAVARNVPPSRWVPSIKNAFLSASLLRAVAPWRETSSHQSSLLHGCHNLSLFALH